ncbi:hypothetical protein Btru_057503 [Bulinus truncatus]|nr:hypothetical protein Btru_057503 [Bulinus truncatus]
MYEVVNLSFSYLSKFYSPAKGGHLYTVKNDEKMNILRNYAEPYWVGLDDIQGKESFDRLTMAKRVHLYTIKNALKMKILLPYNMNIEYWVGLNDIQVEGVYSWIDDGSIISQSQMKEYFMAELDQQRTTLGGEDQTRTGRPDQNFPSRPDQGTDTLYSITKQLFTLFIHKEICDVRKFRSRVKDQDGRLLCSVHPVKKLVDNITKR